MATTTKTKLVLIPWEHIVKIRVQDDLNNAGEYVIEGCGGSLIGYDLSELIAKPTPDSIPNLNPQLISQENGPGKGWMHALCGRADNPHLFNYVMRRLKRRDSYLLMVGVDGRFSVVGNEYGGDMQLFTGGYLDLRENKWHEGDKLDYEFICLYQHYPYCIYKGEIDIRPIEDWFAAK